MAKDVEIKGQVIVNADDFRKWQRTQAGANAAKKRADALKAKVGIPAANEETAGSWLIVDGNNNPWARWRFFTRRVSRCPRHGKRG